ncbi:MAG: MBL fold metallo-hydrolase [bacterium]|nr:MBL fold metallo-hydrolase [bacterium]
MSKFKYYFLLFLLLMTVPVWWGVWEIKKPGEFRVIFFDVGQGDSIFIKDRKQHQILIDGGEGRTVLSRLGRVMPFFDRSLDLVILTHPDKDHLDGILEVLKKYQVNQVFYTGIAENSASYQEFLKILGEKKIKIAFPFSGQKLHLADGARLNFLSPSEDVTGKKFKDTNQTSFVIRLVNGEKEYLFTGDAGIDVETKLIKNNVYLRSDILKIGHHGSKNSTSENFLKAVSPRQAVISVGENKYGHPSPEVLGRLDKLGIEISRTDEKGNIEY